MSGIVITALLATSMWVAIWLLTGRRRREPELPTLPGQLTPAQRRRLYKRLGLDPALMARRRGQTARVIPFPTEARRRSTRA